jgi:hypothetical protein
LKCYSTIQPLTAQILHKDQRENNLRARKKKSDRRRREKLKHSLLLKTKMLQIALIMMARLYLYYLLNFAK